MKSLPQSVLESMDASDEALLPYFPYLFQDVWALGTDPQQIVDIAGRYFPGPESFSVLDLGCGKGAISIQLAKAFSCTCLGIDAVSAFIETANQKASTHQVEQRCRFEIGDIRDRITSLGQYDLILLGAIGPVLGDYATMLRIIRPHLYEDGIILVDDSYFPEGYIKTPDDEAVQTLKILQEQIHAAGMTLTENIRIPAASMQATNEKLFQSLQKRTHELALQHPEHAAMLEAYLAIQLEENQMLENEAINAILVMQPTQEP